MTWTDFSFMNRKIQLFIDGYDNKRRNIEIEILQHSQILPILFLIYISRLFNKTLKTSILVRSGTFVDDLRFVASGSLVKSQ